MYMNINEEMKMCMHASMRSQICLPGDIKAGDVERRLRDLTSRC